MVGLFIAFRWGPLSTPVIRLFLLGLILLLLASLNFLPVWSAVSRLRFRLPSRLPMMFILWLLAMMDVAIERAGSTDTEALLKALRGGQFKTLLADVTIRDFDGQATFGYYTGFTYANPNFPFKRLKNVIRAEGKEVLRTKAEIEQA